MPNALNPLVLRTTRRITCCMPRRPIDAATMRVETGQPLLCNSAATRGDLQMPSEATKPVSAALSKSRSTTPWSVRGRSGHLWNHDPPPPPGGVGRTKFDPVGDDQLCHAHLLNPMTEPTTGPSSTPHAMRNLALSLLGHTYPAESSSLNAPSARPQRLVAHPHHAFAASPLPTPKSDIFPLHPAKVRVDTQDLS